MALAAEVSADDRQVVGCENGALDVVVLGRLRVLSAAGNGILAALGQSKEHLVGLQHLQRGAVRAVDVHSVEEDPHLGRALGVYDDAAVGELAGDHVSARVGDVHAPGLGVGART